MNPHPKTEMAEGPEASRRFVQVLKTVLSAGKEKVVGEPAKQSKTRKRPAR